ncbi:unnamed protein product [Didymodactylos carnosus]|uniref:Uncharacterized protein n=1 Tax=Didymodactylos carnosus TaxID=1234261 RepID=A0A814TAE6_9BILA|nr:unnamed protein product [Didymodactylos carnosus]CAF1159355.1 unnamed protein product [Didymodactylos carnosus]CAF3791943.1 unnamed protein product [Didymodactylos carnosus]CAF3922823.1 unnamed protein product [Didymodactylos carnosus]
MKLEIRIDNIVTKIIAAVTKSLCCSCILRQDWIQKYDATIATKYVQIATKKGKATVKIDQDSVDLPVQLLKTIPIKLYHEVVVHAVVPVSQTNQLIFQPTNNNLAIIMPHALLHVDQYLTTLTIYNPNNRNCILSKNTFWGTVKY